MIDRDGIRAELEKARATFHSLLESASEEELARLSYGTRWTNRQLLYHMMFGYIVVLALLPLVKFVSRLPNSLGRSFAALLDAAATPFHSINYWGSRAGSRLYPPQRMDAKFDAVVAALERRLATEHETSLALKMAFPMRWDPFFKDSMTLADVYHYATQHFAFHERQLTLR